MEKVSISIITPSARLDGLTVVDKALHRQTLKDFEWIVISPHDLMSYSPLTLMKSLQDPPKKEGDVWSLNKAYNEAIRASTGDLIISWQDYTSAQPDALERFYKHFIDEPKTLVSAVGGKYTDSTWAVKIWQDPRERSDQGSYYGCYWNDIEANLCSWPREAVYVVGGFMEDLDKRYGLDAFSLHERINEVGGYDFKIDQGIKSYSLEHGRLHGQEWDEKNWIQKDLHLYEQEKADLRLQGKWPISPYLKSK